MLIYHFNIMKGITKKIKYGDNKDNWVVEYTKYLDGSDNKYFEVKSLKIFTTDKTLVDNQEVEFNIITEFTNPELYEGIGWGCGETYAKLN